MPLACHPATPTTPGVAVAVGACLEEHGNLRAVFRIADSTALRIPAPAAAVPRDGLWRHTCCEAFVAGADPAAYREFNLSPSTEWAVYAFTDYRQRDADWQSGQAPRIALAATGGQLELAADIPAALLPAGPVLHIGLTAVLEAADGGISYWALRHTGQQADFHRRASFTLTLARP